MFKKLKAWRRKHWPTQIEQFQDGDAFAAEEISKYGIHDGVNVIMSLPSNKRNAFDRGMINHAERAMAQYHAGWKCADQIIEKASYHVAVEVITRKNPANNPAYQKGMEDRLLKEQP
ncbi:hypothetical protein KIP58_21845 [Xanthomonas campestris pv. campestris]|nr:hypothetical protein [Xanthomonas campestris]MCF8861631.1 hypothetical protein [Xanthomonas campestris pv. campestris]